MRSINIPSLELEKIDFTLPINETFLMKKPSLNLEIGCGNGDFLVQAANYYPNQIFIGCDIKKSRYLKTAKKILTSNPVLENAFVYLGDGLTLLESFPNESLQSFYINFPDPWPKKRHYKRRFFYDQKTVELVYKKLKPKGHLYFASDHKEYFFFTLKERLMLHNDLKCLLEDGYTHSLENYFTTHYEKKWQKMGRLLFYTKFEKNS